MAWHELSKSWHDTTVEYCDVCGNLLIARFWSFTEPDRGKTLRCCDETCERLFHRLRRLEESAADP